MNIIACMNGAAAFGIIKDRTYLSDIVAKTMGFKHGKFNGTKTLYTNKKGTQHTEPQAMLSVRRGSRLWKSKRAMKRYIQKYNSSENTLFLFGKSTGVFNFIEIFKQLGSLQYKEVHFMAVDGNFGPRLKNRNAEQRTLNCSNTGNTLNFFQTGAIGGFKINRVASHVSNVEVADANHFQITGTPEIQQGVTDIYHNRLH